MKRTAFAISALAAGAVVIAGAALAQQGLNIAIATGGTGGVYYPLGGGMANVLSKHVPGMQASARVTGGSVDNLKLIGSQQSEVALVMVDAALDALKGEDKFKGNPVEVRTLMVLYPNRMHVVTVDGTGINSMADLKGKRVSVGAPKSGTELNSRAILAAAGMTYKDLGKVEYLPFAESVDLMKNRQLGATLQSAGLGVASLKDLSSSASITVVSVPKETIDKIGPPFISAIIPANTYTGQDKDVPTAAVVNYLVTSSAVSDDLAYQMTKLIFESLPELQNAHAAGKEIKLEAAATGSPVPLHPGAIRYYKEKGLIK